ncbi:SCO family protein [Adhaeribacter arboris]|uniref:SCO family protein n=1 Tax=Adhaeribacter arboris TaxID=2072846 RepID=A0A2T2YC86_9BACT|nr:SCO family protein [Adhaeribacter arboris]PSR53127.1 SCO family protein [Adhaeribacter arboris]
MRINKKFKFLVVVNVCAAWWGGILLSSCESAPQVKQPKLPKLGIDQIVQREVNGQKINDTIYARIPDFKFVDQDSQQVTNQTFAGKIYISDFFFTTCPTICPKMRTQMLRVYERFKDSTQVLILSHTIDPKHDSIRVLNEYAQLLGVNTAKWHFVTGEKDSIYAVAQKYLVAPIKEVKVNESVNVIHSGAFVLVDKNRHVRGIYDGTDETQVNKLLQDIPILLKEEHSTLNLLPQPKV